MKPRNQILFRRGGGGGGGEKEEGWLRLHTREKLLFFKVRVLCHMKAPVSFGGFQIHGAFQLV